MFMHAIPCNALLVLVLCMFGLVKRMGKWEGGKGRYLDKDTFLGEVYLVQRGIKNGDGDVNENRYKIYLVR